MQSEDIYTAAQKHCGMADGGRYPHILRSRGVKKPSKRVWSAWHTRKKKYDQNRIFMCELRGDKNLLRPRFRHLLLIQSTAGPSSGVK
jgi:hypothetical protein